jgi:ABC-type branched-subunit amino acid transport system ATPase component
MNGSAQPILEAKDVHLSFGGVRAVAGVDLAVAEHEIVAIIGPNGAGKTSFFNALTGYFFPSAGTVSLRGRDITRMRNFERIRLGMSRTFQTPSIFAELTVRENIMLGVQAHAKMAFSMRGLGSKRRELEARVDELLSFVQLERAKERQVATLSHGGQRLVEIAMSLSTSPSCVLLDEPTAGLAAADTTRIMEVVSELHERLGLTVVFVEHNMRFVNALAHSVICMNRGTVICRGTPSSVLADAQVREAYLGSEEIAHV